MQAIGTFLGGLGVFGILIAAALGFLIFLVIPIWAIFDCVESKREGGTKVLIIILLILTWGVGSLIYSAFFSSSRALRTSTILAVSSLVLIVVVSLGALMGGAKIFSDRAQKQAVVAQRQLVEAFKPEPIDKGALDPFMALHFVPQSPAVAEFTLAGPNLKTAFSVDPSVRHVIYDSKRKRYYALTAHEFGAIDPSTGKFAAVEIDAVTRPDFSWPTGLAMNPGTGEVIILSSHVDNKYFVFEPETGQWRKIPAGRGYQPLLALAYSPDDEFLYALEEPKNASVSALRKFNLSGADLGSLTLAPAIPVTKGQSGTFQLVYSAGRLVLIAPPLVDAKQGSAGGVRIFAIDPKNGTVFIPV